MSHGDDPDYVNGFNTYMDQHEKFFGDKGVTEDLRKQYIDNLKGWRQTLMGRSPNAISSYELGHLDAIGSALDKLLTRKMKMQEAIRNRQRS